MHSNDALLELDGLTKRFGAVPAVDGVSERIPRGEYLCVLGPSGCGKTTLLRLIAGFETPDRGAIRLHGEDMAGIPPERRDVNVVFQSYALFPHLSVAKNIAFGLRMKKLGRAEIEQRVDEAIRLVRLERESSRLPRELSGGQQQRVALARALVNRPSLLLLDEPLSALDASLRQHMQSELRRVQRETGVTFLHITHDQAEALSLADRLVVMQAGRIEQVGTPREVYERPVSRFVASFVGAANLLDGRVIDSDHVGLAAGSVVRVPTLPETVLVGHALTLAVRPEAVTLGPPDAASGLCGRVVHAAFKGSDLECSIELSSETVPSGTFVRARAPARPGTTPVAEGESVSLRVREADWVVLPATDPGEPL